MGRVHTDRPDLPFFLFIVGVSITLSRRSGHWTSIVWRAVKIVALGLFLAGYPKFVLATWRIPGVLQRIGLCYLASAFIYRWTGAESSARDDRRTAWRVGTIAIALLLGYWAFMMLMPGSTGVRGDLSPETNPGAVIDRALMGTHLWKKVWDPEGVASTLPAIASTLLGILAGLWLRSGASAGAKALGFAVAGVAGIAIGGAWSLTFPLIKNLWTSSYVVYTAGWAALFLAICYWLVDIKGVRRPMYPLVVLGTNAIALFAFSALLVKTLITIKVMDPLGKAISLNTWIYRQFFEPLASPVNASLLFSIANLILLYGVLWVMYKRGIFLKV